MLSGDFISSVVREAGVVELEMAESSWETEKSTECWMLSLDVVKLDWRLWDMLLLSYFLHFLHSYIMVFTFVYFEIKDPTILSNSVNSFNRRS
jgi:hypothetical protein